MSQPATFCRVIWAIDPFGEDIELQRQTFRALSTVVGERTGAIEPTSVVLWENRYEIGKKEITRAEYEQKVLEKIKGIEARFGAKGLAEPTVLVQESYSLGLAVHSLLDHAEERGADLIALGTQAREGTTRFLLGSFAETVVLHSQVPTLIVSPRTKPFTKVERILFPTDFSEEAKIGFRSALVFAKETGAKVTLFHVNFTRDIAECEAMATALLLDARERGIQIDLVIQNGAPSATDAILEVAEKNDSTIIAMVSKEDPSGRVLVGGITRQIIRHAQSPVWVLHPKLK